MMIDRSRIAGDAAYLRVPGAADVNLAVPAGGSSGEAVSIPLTDGMQLDVAAIDLLIEGDHLEGLLARGLQPLLSFGVRKELFPGLFADPYRHRVHTVAGFEDLQRGTLARVEVLELDGYPTLVSTDAGPCVWQSAVYRIPHPENEPAVFTAVAWDMGGTRLAPREGLEYHLGLRTWGLAGGPQVVMLAGDPATMTASPRTPRVKQAPPGDVLFKAASFQIILEAAVHQDSSISERHVGEGVGHSLGRPILRAVNLLERVDTAFEYRSLQELMAAADAVKCLEDPSGTIKAVSCKLPLKASLAKDERLSLSVAPGVLSRLEARIDGTLSLRPFDPDRT